MASTFGALTALAGIEHGIGETLQGNVAPKGMMILSWPEASFFQIMAGEPAMTVVSNLLATGILAILFSTIFLVWATMFVQEKYGGLVLILLSTVLLLVGGGFGPPIFGVVIGAAATRINSPPTWWRAQLPDGLRHFLGKLWPWSYGACLLAWLSMFPGTNILYYFFGVDNPNLIFILLLFMFGFLFLTIITGFAHEIQSQIDAPFGALDSGVVRDLSLNRG